MAQWCSYARPRGAARAREPDRRCPTQAAAADEGRFQLIVVVLQRGWMSRTLARIVEGLEAARRQ